ncbi:hypothetical protein ARMGADRAFT_80786 [Armillaria gallica]|uniref:Uncharacterized protein n=1 Tax=Armillaria gallica TaxID=47427 RepID=A0A2H3CEK7_ARMGA|nr:hypothetical protein ARMGADRAFT_80786 [Armillaria gallica]
MQLWAQYRCTRFHCSFLSTHSGVTRWDVFMARGKLWQEGRENKCAYMRLEFAPTTCALLFKCLGNPTHSCRKGLLSECNYRSRVECSYFGSRIICYRPASSVLLFSSCNLVPSLHRGFRAKTLAGLLAKLAYGGRVMIGIHYEFRSLLTWSTFA